LPISGRCPLNASRTMRDPQRGHSRWLSSRGGSHGSRPNLDSCHSM
jgi:hypothetical protein